MTVQTSSNVATGIGNGVTTVFPVGYKFNEESDLVVLRIDDATSAAETLTLNSDYTVQGAGNEAGGSVTMAAPLAVGKTLTITRIVDILQLTDLRNQGKFFAEVHEDSFDRFIMIMQQLFQAVGDSLQLNAARNRWDAKGRRIINVGDPVDAQDAVTKTWLEDYIAGLLQTAIGPVQTAASVIYIGPNGQVGTLQDLTSTTDPTKGVAIVGRGGQVIGSVAALRLLSKDSPSKHAFVTGYYEQGDGGGGAYYLDPSDTVSTDNGGTVIVAADGARWKLSIIGAVSLKQFGARGNGVDDDLPQTQIAVDFCVQNGVALYVPPCVFILDTTSGPVYLSNTTAPGQGLLMFGAGRGRSIIKEADGSTEAGGRFTKMFYFYYGAAAGVGDSVGSFTFRGITFDKNGSSNSAPPTLYEWEQAHIFSWAGTTVRDTNAVTFEGCEFRDKIGACVNFSSSETRIKSLVLRDIQSTDHPKVTEVGDGTFGQRGCFEFGVSSTGIVIDSCNAAFAQIEPVIPSSASLVRHARFINSNIEYLEFTDKGGYSSVDVTACKCYGKLLFRGVDANILSSEFAVPDIFTDRTIRVSQSVIRLPYNSTTGAVTPMSFGSVTGYTGNGLLDISNSKVVIDSDTVSATATGFGIRGNGNVAPGTRAIRLRDVEFDPRLYGSVDVYQTADLDIESCKLAGLSTGYAVQVGGNSSFGGSVRIGQNDWSQVAGPWVRMLRNNEVWRLRWDGVYKIPANTVISSVGSASLTATIESLPKFRAAAAPASGFWIAGQRVENLAPIAGGSLEFVCVTTGSPGTWKNANTIAV